MAEIKRENTNLVDVIGTVKEIDFRYGTSKKGVDFCRGTVSIVSVINEVENVIKFNVFANKVTAAGAESAQYKNVHALEEGKRVKVLGSFEESFIPETSTGEVKRINRIKYGTSYTSGVPEVDSATFSFGGFVTKGLYEVNNKDGELLGYRMEVGQVNYTNENMNNLVFDVHKDDVDIQSALESNYLPGSTVSFSGELNCTSTQVKSVKEVAFGKATETVRTEERRLYFIKGGNAPFEEENALTYTEEEMTNLIAAREKTKIQALEDRKAYEAGLATKTQAQTPAAGVATKPKTNIFASLA